MPKTKVVKKREAEARQAEYDALSHEDKIARATERAGARGEQFSRELGRLRKNG